MNNSPSNENTDNTTPVQGGDIFSGPDQSAYSQATNIDKSPAPYQSEAENTSELTAAIQENNPPPIGAMNEPPPMYSHSNAKKYLILLFFIFLIIGIVFLIFKIIKGRSTPVVNNAPVKLTYWGLWESKDVLQPIIDEYRQSHPNVDIEYIQQNPNEYRERLQAAIDRGDGPDVFRFHNTWTPMFIKELDGVPDSIYNSEDYKKIFYPAALDSLKINNKYYGIPLEIDGLMLFYNEDILKASNVSVPKTWTDVKDAVAKMTVKSSDKKIATAGIALGTAENVEHFSDILGMMMLQNGTQLWNSLFSCSRNNTTNCGVETMTFYRSFAEDPLHSWDETMENSITSFAGGKVAMIFAPSWEVAAIKKLSPDLKFKTAIVPQLPCQNDTCPKIGWASFWVEGVAQNSQHKALAWEFLKFLSQKDTLQKLFDLEAKQNSLFGEPYSRVDMADLLKTNTYLEPIVEQAPYMKSFYLASKTSDGATGLDTSMITYLKDSVNSLSSGVSPETALKTADDGFKQVLGRFGVITAP